MMRRTILMAAGAALVLMSVVLAPVAVADTQTIPVTCTMVSIQRGWGEAPGVLDWEVFEFWLGDAGGTPNLDGDYLWHIGTGWYEVHGDRYCRGKWDVNGGWWISPPPVGWPPTEDSQGHFFGTFHIELSHANIEGGFDITYSADTVFDRERNRVYEGTALGGGWGELEGWTITLDYYLPYDPPAGGPGDSAHLIWTGFVTPAGS